MPSAALAPDALLEHVDRALHLCAEAWGETASAGTAAFGAMMDSPLASIKKWRGQRKARAAMEAARPHLKAIVDARAAALSRIEAKELGHVGWMTADLVSELAGNVGGAILDVVVHDRIEDQRLVLGQLVEELGALHARLRAARQTA